MKYQILHGDNRETLKTIADNSIDAIVTDPPYGIDFLGKDWDANTGALETYQECLRVLKPGGHILAFSAARTYHHLAVTLEQAGFEIRDQIMWIYSSGFPKSQDVGRQLHKKEHGKPDKQRFSKDLMIKEGDNYRHPDTDKLYRILPDINGDRLEKSHEGDGYGYIFEEIITIDNDWSGWGTSLKPAHEPIALARKPIKLSIAKNCQTYGVGALNIDACRVPFEDENDQPSGGENGWSRVGFNETPVEKYADQKKKKSDKEKALNWTPQRQQAGDTTEIGTFGASGLIGKEVPMFNEKGRFPSNVIGEIAQPYQKYFYCPKVSRKERHVGHELPEAEPLNSPDLVRNHPLWDPSIGTNAHRLKEKIRKSLAPTGHIKGPYDENGNRLAVTLDNANLPGNNHPTVKPIELMKYLIKLITPPGGTVLDPFNGSGSTGCAAVELGMTYIGCELDERYVEIAQKRIEAWYAHTNPTTFNQLFEQD